MFVKKINLQEIFIFTILLMSIFPIINLFGFDTPILYLLAPIGLFISALIILGMITIPNIIKPILVLSFLIIIEIFLSTVIGTLTAFNKIIFPSDVMQYVVRFACIITFITWIYHTKVKIDKLIKYFLIIFNIAMLIGILQWIPWPGQSLFLSLYKFREGVEQFAQLNRELHLRRVHGVAQMATANGGIATFMFIFAYSVYSFYKKFKWLTLFLMGTAIVNILASQSRAGIVALLFSLFAFYFVKIYQQRKGFKPTLKFLLALFLVLGVIYFLYINNNPIILQQIYRWNDLFETNGGARTDQINFALNLLTDFRQYIFGISRVFQNYSGIEFFIEIEPVNIFVLYGALGFILQYSLVIYLLWYFIRNIRKTHRPEVVCLLVASFVGLLSYQVFSLGYFFFREIRIGLIPWIVMGVSIGVYERNRRQEMKNTH